MKIFDPKSVCKDGDPSRLGMSARALSLDELEGAAHGIVIVGIADDTGVRNVGGRPGAKDGPRAARERFYKFTSAPVGIPLYDLGDLEPAPEGIERTHREAASVLRRVHQLGHTPLVLGGGHDLAYPEALGLLEARPGKRLGFLNIDAHLDLRPTTNGITSGSPWFLLRETPEFQSSKSRLQEFGIQRHCNTRALVDYAKRHGIGIRWLDEIKKPVPEFRSELLKLAKQSTAIQVSLDIDSVHWSEAPGCSAPQTLGFQAEEAIAMSRSAGASKKVASFGIYELSPALDPDGRTAQLVAHCMLAFLQGRAQK